VWGSKVRGTSTSELVCTKVAPAVQVLQVLHGTEIDAQTAAPATAAPEQVLQIGGIPTMLGMIDAGAANPASS